MKFFFSHLNETDFETRGLLWGISSSLFLGKIFQKRNVSSPAPVTTVSPSGLIARNSTLDVCPVNVATFIYLNIYFKLLIINFLNTFSRVGYFQHTIWFIEYPWVDINSLMFFENNKLQTYEPVSIQSSYYVVCVLKNRMVRSAVPPPDASNPWRCGDHASAFTAA